MPDNLESFRASIQRRAIFMEIGGFRPPENPKSSWFGKVGYGAANEVWPVQEGRPMLPLAQIDLTELPFRPPLLEDIAFLTVFIDSKGLPKDSPNGSGWCLRSYQSLESLEPLVCPQISSSIKALPIRPTIRDADYPCHDDLPDSVPPEIGEDYFDLFENVSGFKLGGWPSLIQSEIFWAPWNKHPFQPEYVFQIDSSEKAGWSWGHGGVGYFGRGTVPGHQDEWALSWQCL